MDVAAAGAESVDIGQAGGGELVAVAGSPAVGQLIGRPRSRPQDSTISINRRLRSSGNLGGEVMPPCNSAVMPSFVPVVATIRQLAHDLPLVFRHRRADIHAGDRQVRHHIDGPAAFNPADVHRDAGDALFRACICTTISARATTAFRPRSKSRPAWADRAAGPR